MRINRLLVFVLFLLGLSSFALSWPINGKLTVSTSLMGWQSDQYCVSDGKGGLIIGWLEDMGGSTYQAYIQRYNKEGQPLWGNNVPLWSKVTGVQNYYLHSPIVASFQNNDIAVCWYQSPRFVVQRFNLEGEALWNNGEPNILFGSFRGDSNNFPKIITDTMDNCFVLASDYDFHAVFKINKEGQYSWGTSGFCSDFPIVNYDIFPDDEGGFYFKYERDCYKLYFQRILSEGTYGLRSTGIFLNAYTQYTPDGDRLSYIVKDNQGNVGCFAWLDYRYTHQWRMQKVNSLGTTLWATTSYREPGVSITTTRGAYCDQFSFTSTEDNGYLLSHSLGGSGFAGTRYALQKMDSEGNKVWGEDGLSIATIYYTDSFVPCYIQSITDGRGGAYVAWRDNREGKVNICLQHVNAAGEFDWGESPLFMTDTTDNWKNIALTSDDEYGVYVSWTNARSLFLTHLNINGSIIPSAGIRKDFWKEYID